MGSFVGQKPVKLIVGIIFKEEKFLNLAVDELKKRYGRCEADEVVLPFNYTNYYEKEFGVSLKRKLICFKKLLVSDKIPEVKVETNNIETALSSNGKRMVNIDPGYLTEAKLVLLTTKDYSHRVYLNGCIFAEATLFFQNNTFNPWPWTYPDYASKEMIDYFNKVRKKYMEESSYKLQVTSCKFPAEGGPAFGGKPETCHL